jgi:hypothetical protein
MDFVRPMKTQTAMIDADMYKVRSDNTINELDHLESEISQLFNAVTGLMRDFADSQREITKLWDVVTALRADIDKLLLQGE